MDKHTDLILRLQNEADLCRNDGATDIAALLDEAAGALSETGYIRAQVAPGKWADVPRRPDHVRWYCVDRDGVAMLCTCEADARAQVAENDACWPGRAPHRAVLLGEVAALEAENAAMKREAHTWWTAARDAAAAERKRCALRVALHSQYPIETDFDRGYDKARKDAADTLRTMGDEPGRPSTPVGWSDTDWIAHLESLRASAEETRYAKGPLPERGWD